MFVYVYLSFFIIVIVFLEYSLHSRSNHWNSQYKLTMLICIWWEMVLLLYSTSGSLLTILSSVDFTYIFPLSYISYIFNWAWSEWNHWHSEICFLPWLSPWNQQRRKIKNKIPLQTWRLHFFKSISHEEVRVVWQ